MENFDRENIDELLEIRQIRQYFPLSKICAVRYSYCDITNPYIIVEAQIQAISHGITIQYTMVDIFDLVVVPWWLVVIATIEAKIVNL